MNRSHITALIIAIVVMIGVGISVNIVQQQKEQQAQANADAWLKAEDEKSNRVLNVIGVNPDGTLKNQ